MGDMYAPPAARFEPGPPVAPTAPLRILARFLSPATLGYLALYELWVAYWSEEEPVFRLLPVLLATFCIVVALGLMLRKRWARFLWYTLVGLLTCAFAGIVAYASILVPWARGDWPGRALLLLPSLLFLTLCFCGVGATRLSHAWERRHPKDGPAREVPPQR
jgi:hypothetical protein